MKSVVFSLLLTAVAASAGARYQDPWARPSREPEDPAPDVSTRRLAPLWRQFLRAANGGDVEGSAAAFGRLADELGRQSRPLIAEIMKEYGGRNPSDQEIRRMRRRLWREYALRNADDPRAHIGLGDASVGDDYVFAVLSYSRAIDLGAQTPGVYYGRGLAADRAGDHELAHFDAQRALAMDPKDARAEALVKLTTGRPSDVRIDLKTGKTRAASGAGPPPGLVSAGAGRPVEPGAARVEKTVVTPEGRATTQTPVARSDALSASAQKSLRMGDAEAALRAAIAAVSLNPLNARAHNLLATARLRKGDSKGALTSAERALAIDPNNAGALVTKSWAESGLGKYDRALTAAERALAQDPMNAFAHAGKARAYGGLGKREEMVDALSNAARLDPRFSGVAENAARLPKGADTELLFSGIMDARKPYREKKDAESGAGRLLGMILATLAGGVLIALGVSHILSSESRGKIGSTISNLIRRREASGEPPHGGSIDQFELGKVLATGGMGVVYEAVDTALGRKVAVKKMRGEIRDDPKLRAAFLKEANLLGRLLHPNIVQIYTVVEKGPDLYLVFEFVPGRTLKEILAQRGALELRQALGVLQGVCAALDYAHTRLIIHRDVKLENFMLTDDGTVKVMDFGLARHAPDAMKTMASTIWGTPAYMAPEAEEGEIRVESDLFALGVCLYELTTGKTPFSGTPGAMYKAKDAGKFDPPTALNPALPAGLDAFMKKALAPKAADRFRNAKEFWAALQTLAPKA